MTPRKLNLKPNFSKKETSIKLFLCGDVMTGRGLDQAFPHSVDPRLYEGYVKDAREYLKLAERENGNIPEPISYEYLWGDALEVWKLENPDFRLINLETAITTSDLPWAGKGINYRMHPKNIDVLKVAGIDNVSLANNHVLDWERDGLKETLKALEKAKVKYSGAGLDEKAARKPAILKKKSTRILVFSYGLPSSGVPDFWSATKTKSGVNYLPDLSESSLRKVVKEIKAHRKKGDIVIFSVHWGGNWGYEFPQEQRDFAHQLIESGVVDLIHGHSSHHSKGLEVYNDRLIIYGAGDFINDYEGISGHEEYRGDLALMYFPVLDVKSGKLRSLKMVPMQIKKFSLNHPSEADVKWLQQTLDRESEKLGESVELIKDELFLKSK